MGVHDFVCRVERNGQCIYGIKLLETPMTGREELFEDNEDLDINDSDSLIECLDLIRESYGGCGLTKARLILLPRNLSYEQVCSIPLEELANYPTYDAEYDWDKWDFVDYEGYFYFLSGSSYMVVNNSDSVNNNNTISNYNISNHNVITNDNISNDSVINNHNVASSTTATNIEVSYYSGIWCNDNHWIINMSPSCYDIFVANTKSEITPDHIPLAWYLEALENHGKDLTTLNLFDKSTLYEIIRNSIQS